MTDKQRITIEYDERYNAPVLWVDDADLTAAESERLYHKIWRKHRNIIVMSIASHLYKSRKKK